MKFRLVFAVLAALPMVVTPRSGQAEDSALSADISGEAKALYDMGRSLFDRNDVSAALGKFTRAHELSNDPRLLWNIAACEARLKHYARAMTVVDRYLATSGHLLTEKDREQAARFRAAASPLVAKIVLAAGPEPIAIAVDGEPPVTTPLTEPLYLDAGEHRIHFTKPGYRGVVRREKVVGGTETTWNVTLERLQIRTLQIR